MNGVHLQRLGQGARQLAAQAGDAVRLVGHRDYVSLVRSAPTMTEEVARAGDRYRPYFGSLSHSNAQTLIAVAREALEGLTPRIVTNRPLDQWTLRMLAEGGAFPTIFTGRASGPIDLAHRAAAWLNMRSTNIYGGSEAAGKSSTIFAAVQFIEGIPAGRTLGVSSFGQIAFDLSDRLIPTTTLTARDSFGASEFVARWDQMPEVIAERIARHHGFIDDVRAPSSTYLASPAALKELVAARKQQLLNLLSGPRQDAVASVRAQLTSPLPTLHHHFIEAQIRGATIDDITKFAVEPFDQIVRATELVHTPRRLRGAASAPPDPKALEILRTLAARRGIVEHREHR